MDFINDCVAAYSEKRKSGLILASALIVDLILCNGILKPLIARIRPFDVNSAIQLIVAKPHDYSCIAKFCDVTHKYVQ